MNAGIGGAQQLSSAKLWPTHFGSGLRSTDRSSEQCASKVVVAAPALAASEAKALPDEPAETPGPGAACATRRAPDAAMATISAALMPKVLRVSFRMLFNISPSIPYSIR